MMENCSENVMCIRFGPDCVALAIVKSRERKKPRNMTETDNDTVDRIQKHCYCICQGNYAGLVRDQGHVIAYLL